MSATLRARDALLVTVAAAAALLMLGSTAFACTHYRGKLTVTDSAGNAVTAVGLNQFGGMNHCSDPRSTGSTQAQVNGSAIPPLGSVVLSTDAATCSAGGGGASQLDAGDYFVSWNSEFGIDCMVQVLGFPEYIDPKLLEVDSNGQTTGTTAERTYQIPALSTAPGNYAGLCITRVQATGVPSGNKAPILVI